MLHGNGARYLVGRNNFFVEANPNEHFFIHGRLSFSLGRGPPQADEGARHFPPSRLARLDRSGGDSSKRLDFRAWLLFGLPQVPLCLYAKPHIGRGTKLCRKAQGHSRSHPGFAVQHLGERDTGILQFLLAHCMPITRRLPQAMAYLRRVSSEGACLRLPRLDSMRARTG